MSARSRRDPARWDQRYEDGDLPWDSGIPDGHLPDVIEQYGIEPGKALEVGCGTGTNSIWLARQGFDVTGLDLSEVAIQRAEKKAGEAGVACRFMAGDFLSDPVPGAPYTFVYDRGCLHTFDRPKDRSRFAARVAELLGPDGLWFSLIGSTDGPDRDVGPPRRSAVEVTAAVEPYFEILELRSSAFDRGEHRRARAWVMMGRRRG
jgi:2-polyprenyl-3-methyl-5-hydroxy-6-metoxy-1,4-benzoquinol methylase